jgi:hypothetical protein
MKSYLSWLPIAPINKKKLINSKELKLLNKKKCISSKINGIKLKTITKSVVLNFKKIYTMLIKK